MANVKTGVTNQPTKTSAPTALGLSALINSANVKARFEKMLGDNSAGFLSSLLTLVNNDRALATADPKTVLASAATAASLELPINKSLGFAWVIAYKGVASFQLGWKGLVQLAQRSGLIKTIVCVEVFEGECKSWNKFTEEFEVGEKVSDNVVGYYASFELINGFKKTTYWTRDEVLAHAKRFSKAFNSGPWRTDETAMSKKTVLSALLRAYAPLSIKMQMGIERDGKVATINESTGDEEFIDVDANETVEAADELPAVEATADGRKVDTETGELLAG
jgi:recombination protein RecT